jgi:hypothetical protein
MDEPCPEKPGYDFLTRCCSNYLSDFVTQDFVGAKTAIEVLAAF